ncbi:MAG: hypothetical protein ACR2FO_09275 [Actinomycetota bacterium]
MYRPARLVLAGMTLLGGFVLLFWALTRDYHDLQRIYGLVLGVVNVAAAGLLWRLAARKRT